jgi:hypothetical protein
LFRTQNQNLEGGSVAPTLLEEADQREIISIVTVAGVTVSGRLISETSRRYLVQTESGSQLVEYATIAEVKTATKQFAVDPDSELKRSRRSKNQSKLSTTLEKAFILVLVSRLELFLA